jgi:O-antigen biosynthesis protein WbqP
MILKKIFKVVRNFICAIGLIIISPFLFFAALMILLRMEGQFFLYKKRLGKNNVIFKIIKIRTLKREAPNTGTHQLDQKYHLICGKLFRKIKLDEFPQLINVLKGDINLIGPRPGLISQKSLLNLDLQKVFIKLDQV